MNYLCLLNEELLRKWIHVAGEKMSKKERDNLYLLFGFTNIETRMDSDLSDLKICLGHFGGDEHWEKYITDDRENSTAALTTHPGFGINFTHNNKGDLSHGKLQMTWYEADWYSIICSMILQYKNLYADISYILHNQDIFPLLRKTLQHRRDDAKPPDNLTNIPRHALGERVLFGTDFYMIRSHNSDRDLLNKTQSQLSRDEFDMIARINPINYLENTL